MSIKNNRPSKKSKFKQGYFKPNYPNKYIGPLPIIYRSSWEYKFMIWCDSNDKVICWSSEPIQIQYWSRQSGKTHKYYPDFYFKQEKSDGSYEEYLVEIKPKDQITKPTPPKKNSAKALESYRFLVEQYVKNMDKYAAAMEYCQNRGWHFIVLTEDTILKGLK